MHLACPRTDSVWVGLAAWQQLVVLEPRAFRAASDVVPLKVFARGVAAIRPTRMTKVVAAGALGYWKKKMVEGVEGVGVSMIEKRRKMQ